MVWFSSSSHNDFRLSDNCQVTCISFWYKIWQIFCILESILCRTYQAYIAQHCQIFTKMPVTYIIWFEVGICCVLHMVDVDNTQGRKQTSGNGTKWARLCNVRWSINTYILNCISEIPSQYFIEDFLLRNEKSIDNSKTVPQLLATIHNQTHEGHGTWLNITLVISWLSYIMLHTDISQPRIISMITSILRQNDVSTSFWRNDDVIITLHVNNCICQLDMSYATSTLSINIIIHTHKLRQLQIISSLNENLSISIH